MLILEMYNKHFRRFWVDYQPCYVFFLGSVTVDIIKQGIHHLKKRTCLKFVELPKEDSQHKSYVKFFSGDG